MPIRRTSIYRPGCQLFSLLCCTNNGGRNGRSTYLAHRPRQPRHDRPRLQSHRQHCKSFTNTSIRLLFLILSATYLFSVYFNRLIIQRQQSAGVGSRSIFSNQVRFLWSATRTESSGSGAPQRALQEDDHQQDKSIPIGSRCHPSTSFQGKTP